MRRLLLFAILLSVCVSAIDFDVNIFPTERSIKTDEVASFELELSHVSPDEQSFEVYSNDVTWDIRTEKPLSVDGRLKTNLLVRPLNLNPGAYNLPVVFRHVGSSDQKRVMLYLELSSPFPEDATYLPAIRGVGVVDAKIDPRDSMVVKLSLENQNNRDLKNVEVKIRSDVLNKDYSTSLGPSEKKSLTFEAELDPFTSPQKDALRISVIVPEKEKAYQFDLMPVPFEVIPYGSVVDDVVSDSSFLKYVDTIIFNSESNKVVTHVYRVPAWFVKRLFISSVPEPKIESGELVWEVILEPSESFKVSITYNYRPILWFLIILSVLFVVYFVFRSPITVVKKVSVIGSDAGGITELKVVVELINRSRKVVRNLHVMDLTPKLTDVQQFKENMLSPSKIVHNEKGTLVRWDIDMMESGEHRILMYKMRTRLHVVGGMTLPVVAVKFVSNGQEREVVSSKAEVRHKV